MSRYVEAETLVRWICGNKCGCERDECGYDIPCQQVQLLEGAPSIDIVRCGECKYWKSTVQMPNGTEVKCLYGRKADDFCSYGSRSEKPNNSKVSEKPTGSEKPNNSTISILEQVDKDINVRSKESE